MQFNLEYYRAFFVTANFKSFTLAAKQLCLTQSAVSQSVRKLETELSTPLFVRSPHGLTLTEGGALLYSHVQKAFAELSTAERFLTRSEDIGKRELKIGATETSLRFLIAPILEKFKRHFPNVRITFIGSTTRNTCESLKNDEIEVAFLITPIPAEFHFEMTKLHTIQDLFVAGSNFAIDCSKTYTPQEIIRYPMIYVTPENSVRSHIDRWFLEENIVFSPDFTVKGTGLILPLVQNHLGIGILPRDYVREGLASQSLKEISVTKPLPPRTLYLATKPGLAHSFAADALLRELFALPEEEIGQAIPKL